jgi:hypothetical protein
MLSRANLIWDGDQLYRAGSRRPLLTLIRDEKYPCMWRVRMPDGRLSDIANRTWAKEAAAAIALSILKARETAREGRTEATAA